MTMQALEAHTTVNRRNEGQTNEARNLTPTQWSHVLSTDSSPMRFAEMLVGRGPVVPWTKLLLQHTQDCDTVLDLGSGRGDHSALLARAGRRPTLMDWSPQNVEFSRRLFAACGVAGQFCVGDLTRPLPFASNSVDAVFSCGVLEYFDRPQVAAIIGEAFRVARRRVIVLVPNAFSVAYRVGKWYMERTGAWTWGGEVPSYSLKRIFDQAGAVRTTELTVAARHSLDFLVMPFGDQIKRACIRVLRMRHHVQPAWARQGYLLVTIGEKEHENRS
jgi:ubiquinone/menaquinone biosynthesis C-methylase UbiE